MVRMNYLLVEKLFSYIILNDEQGRNTNDTFFHFLSAASLDDLINAIVEADNRGVTLAPMADASYGNTSEQESVPSWSFGQSFFFASTVVTTIGILGF